MDVNCLSSLEPRCNMTIAEKTARRPEFLAELRDRIRNVLIAHSEPMSLSMIEAYLNKESLDQGGRPGIQNTFDVRDAVAELIEDGEAAFTVGRKIIRILK